MFMEDDGSITSAATRNPQVGHISWAPDYVSKPPVTHDAAREAGDITWTRSRATFDELVPRYTPPAAANDNGGGGLPPVDVPVAAGDDDGHNPKRAYGVRKPSPQFIPPVAIIEESVVMALGAAKYGAYNWIDDPIDATTYYSAAMRHLMSWFSGEDKDPESGASHLAHVRACCAILMDAGRIGSLIDDRPHCSSASAVIAELTRKL